MKFFVNCFIFLYSFLFYQFTEAKKIISRTKLLIYSYFILGCLAVAANGDNGEISCSQCRAIIKAVCQFYRGLPERCVEEADFVCQSPCNGCQGVTDYFCGYAPSNSVDACIAKGEQLCLEENSEGNGKGWGKGQGNGKGWGKGKGNDSGGLSCLQCQAMREDLCEFASSKGKRTCLGEGNFVCGVACNQCQEFTEYLCTTAETVSPDTCIASVEQVCQENNGKGNGKGWGNGKGRFLY